jgi:hypothetical protein
MDGMKTKSTAPMAPDFITEQLRLAFEGRNSYTLKAHGGVLRYFQILFLLTLIGATYVYFVIGFKVWLLILYILALFEFLFWGHSIKLNVSQEGINWEMCFSSKIFFKWEEISEMTMGTGNLLIMRSIDPNQKAMEINYFLLFNKRELAKILKLMLRINPNIVVDGRTNAFLRRDGASVFSELLRK